MLSANLGGLPVSNKVWILVAHRAGARLFETDGGTKNFRLLQDIPHPEGRLKPREIDADRDGAPSESGSSYSRLGALVNKGDATAHVMEVFAKQLGEIVNRGRSQEAFARLVIVADSRMLGEIRSELHSKTAERVTQTLDKDLSGLEDRQIKERIRELMF